MKKQEFVRLLRAQLQHIQKEELDELLQDYEEHFALGVKEGRHEAEIAKSLGSPKAIARQINADYHMRKAESKATPRSIARAVFAAAGLGFFNLIFVLGPLIAAAAVLFALIVTALAIVIAGAAVAGWGIFNGVEAGSITGLHPLALVLFSIGLVAIGLLMAIGCYYCTKIFGRLTMRYLRWNIGIVRGKGIQEA